MNPVQPILLQRRATNDDDHIPMTENPMPMDRRRWLTSTSTSLATLLGPQLVLSAALEPAQAYDREYPIELQSTDTGASERDRKVNRIMEQKQREKEIAVEIKPLTAATWASALWFLSGSRSNPLATPLANILYDPSQEDWLKDRNDGLFAKLPVPLLVALAIVYFAAGAIMDSLIQLIAEPSTSFPLAGVALIAGATLELGRFASGVKRLTRDEYDRASQLRDEFEVFATQRLRSGGTCHRQDVVKAFRRFYAKYRQAPPPQQQQQQQDNDPTMNGTIALTDLEIERLLRAWSRTRRDVEMSSSGFYSGLQINTDADVFVER